MRSWRIDRIESPEAQRAARARSTARYEIRKGRLQRQRCWRCGDPQTEMHHPNYDYPLMIIWLCRKHHVDLHYGQERPGNEDN